tara:strand:- start:330 stop:722 length:393 start_codon:yes stop_codon:yes gene_type:complete
VLRQITLDKTKRGQKMSKNKQHKQYVVAMIEAPSSSSSIPGTTRSKVHLLDIANNFKWCYTWVSENNWNYDQWDKLYQEDYHENAFVIDGYFVDKKGTPDLVSADAKFTITERADRQELLYQIAKSLGLL